MINPSSYFGSLGFHELITESIILWHFSAYKLSANWDVCTTRFLWESVNASRGEGPLAHKRCLSLSVFEPHRSSQVCFLSPVNMSYSINCQTLRGSDINSFPSTHWSLWSHGGCQVVKSDSVTLVLVYLKVVCFCIFTGSEALAGFSQSPFGTNMVPAFQDALRVTRDAAACFRLCIL